MGELGPLGAGWEAPEMTVTSDWQRDGALGYDGPLTGFQGVGDEAFWTGQPICAFSQ